MAKYDQTGIPSIVAAKSADASETLFEDVVTPQPLAESLSSLVRAALDKFTDEAVIIIDPLSRKVTAATGSQGALLKAAFAGGTGDAAVLSPETGQTGRSLTWEATGIGNLSAPYDEAANAAFDAAKPRRTVEGLVAALLTGIDYTTNALPVIMIDQAEAEVTMKVEESAGAVQTLVNAVSVAGDQIQMALTEPETVTTSNLIFEGGATS
jgi:hypothetical protein